MTSMAPEFETRETCEGCVYHDTMPESSFAVSLVGHYCFINPGSPVLRGVSIEDNDYPLGCRERWVGK